MSKFELDHCAHAPLAAAAARYRLRHAADGSTPTTGTYLIEFAKVTEVNTSGRRGALFHW